MIYIVEKEKKEMNEKEVVEHATKLFKNEVIREIEFIFKSDKN